MLFNTEKLQGMPKKIKALAKREAQVSLVQQVYTAKHLACVSLQTLAGLYYKAPCCTLTCPLLACNLHSSFSARYMF